MKENVLLVFIETSLDNIKDNIFNLIPMANKYKFYAFNSSLIFQSKQKS